MQLKRVRRSIPALVCLSACASFDSPKASTSGHGKLQRWRARHIARQNKTVRGQQKCNPCDYTDANNPSSGGNLRQPVFIGGRQRSSPSQSCAVPFCAHYALSFCNKPFIRRILSLNNPEPAWADRVNYLRIVHNSRYNVEVSLKWRSSESFER